MKEEVVDYKLYPKDDALHNGTWNLYEHDGLFSVMFKDTFGHIGSLTDHQISEDGIVSPSVVCPKDGCSYHEHIRLEGWVPVNRG
jgi:hypothetical protein